MTIKELSEKRQELVVKARALNDAAFAEKRSMTAEEQQTWDSYEKEIDGLRSQIDELHAAENRSAFLANEERDMRRSRGRITHPDVSGDAPDIPEQRNKACSLYETPEYRSAYQSYIQRGLSRMGNNEYRALQADSDVQGGYLTAPVQMVSDLLKFVDNLVFVRTLAKKFTVTSSGSMGVPTLENDPSAPLWTAEIQTGNEDSSMSFGKRELHPHPLAKRIKVSRALLRAATMGVESLVNDRLGYQFAIATEAAYLSGSGQNQPLGVFTASDNGIPTSRDVSTDNTGTAITADGLINAKYSLKSQYMNSPMTRWGFHRDGVRNIRKLKDGNGQYIWSAGLGGTPDTILEIPYFMSEYVPNTFTSGQYVGILGDWNFYWICDALGMGLQRLDELYAETNQVGFIGRLETDGMPVLAEAFARVKLG